MSEGWICPICGRGKAPWVMECDCRSKTITTTKTDTASIDWETPFGKYSELLERYMRERAEGRE